MGVFDKANAKDLIGMEADELKAKLDSAASKEDIDAIKAEIAASAGSLSEIKAALAELTKKPEVTPEVDPTDPRDQMLLDPQGFVNKQTQGLARQQAEMKASLNELRARQNPEYANVFAQFGKEIDVLAGKFTPEQRAQDGFYDWHIKTLLGHKMLTREIKPDAYPSLLGSSSVAPNDGDPATDPNKGFDPEMAKWFRDRHPEDKNILEKMAKINQLSKDGEPMSLATYKGVARA